MKRILKNFLGTCLAIGLLIAFTGCSTLRFYDSGKAETTMKESCLVEFGDNVANIVFNEKMEEQEIGTIGKNHYILPAGKYTFVYFESGYGEWVNKGHYRQHRIVDGVSARSETFDFEAGKRYRLERVGKIINIIDTEKRGISENGTLAIFRSGGVINVFGWQYSNGINVAEFGPSIGLSIATDPVVMHIAGEAAIGIGCYGIGIPDSLSVGFSFRTGGSLINFFQRSGFGIGFGGGLIGHILTIPLVGADVEVTYDHPGSLYPIVPYVQLKGFFGKLGEFDGVGIYMDYYPTISPTSIGSFGFGFTGIL